MNSALRQPKILSFVLGLSMFVVGICGISYEYSFSKLASDILGNSVRQWAIIIGLMMLFMGIGADLQKHFKDEKLVDNFILIELLLALVGGFGPSVSLYFFGQYHDYFMVVHYGLVAFVGLMIGLEIPLLTRVNERTLPSLKENLGLILKMDYLGSFIGALVWIFILPLFFNLLSISYVLGLLNLLVAIGTGLFFLPWMQRPRLIFGFAFVILIALVAGLQQGEKIEIALEQKLYQDPVIFAQTTPYQRLVLTEKKSGEVYFYINGHLQFSSFDEAIYHEMLVHSALAMLDAPKRVLVLGGGDGLAVREILKYPSVENVTLVDLDPAVVELAKTHPKMVALNKGSLSKAKLLTPQGVTQGEKLPLEQQGHGFFLALKENHGVQLHVMNLDAYNFIESIPGRYDAIILDFPDPSSLALSKLYSLEFYQHLQSRLNVGGVLIQQSSSPVFAKEAFLMIGRTMEAAGLSTLPLRHTVPSFGEWGFWIAGHGKVYHNKGLQIKLGALQRIPVPTAYLTPSLIQASQHFGKDGLTAKGKRINKMLDDQITAAYLSAWEAWQ